VERIASIFRVEKSANWEPASAGGCWIDLAQDRDQCSALVNTVMNLRVP
jgi:hypothetical protein